MIPTITVSPVLARTPKGPRALIVICVTAGSAVMSVEASRALRVELERAEQTVLAAKGMSEAEQDLMASLPEGRA
jgi:hypothetical protein